MKQLVRHRENQSLNKEAKKSFLKNQKTENEIFFGGGRELCKSFCTEKGFHYKQKFTVKTTRGVTKHETKIANIFNNSLIIITKALNIPAWNHENSGSNTDLEKILETFEVHPSVRYIKEVSSDTNFRLQHVLPLETYQTIMELNKNKATNGNIPTKVLRRIARNTCVLLTDCINSALLNGVFS